MIKTIIRFFIKNPDKTTDPEVRKQYGVLAGVLGIICNIFLFVVKLINGIFLHSIAVMSDAFNNLSDTLSSCISIISAKLSAKKPDKEHPYGHGRLEYIATLFVAFLIMLVGFQLLLSSGKKIIDGLFFNQIEPFYFRWISIIILTCSLAVKLWMFSFNRHIGKKIQSSLLLATASDSLSDVLTSGVVILSTIVGYFWLSNHYYILDGIMGIVVAVIIFINGIKLVIKTINELLGHQASEEEMKQIESFLLSEKRVLGIHDLMIHDYGPGRKFASVHCEVDERENIRAAHEMIDALETKAENALNLQLVIHMDPINTTSPITHHLQEIISHFIQKTDLDLSFHDLRIVEGEEQINVIFDLVFPYSYKDEEIKQVIDELIRIINEEDARFHCIVKIDHHYQ